MDYNLRKLTDEETLKKILYKVRHGLTDPLSSATYNQQIFVLPSDLSPSRFQAYNFVLYLRLMYDIVLKDFVMPTLRPDIDKMKGTDKDLAAHFKIIKNYGVVLQGKAINDVLMLFLMTIIKSISLLFGLKHPIANEPCRYIPVRLSLKIILLLSTISSNKF